MNFSIRRTTDEDAEGILNVHYQAVHTTAAKDYPQEILDEWSRTVTQERIEEYLSKPKIYSLVAKADGEIVGFGEVLPDQNILGAIYVSPRASRKGIGHQLLIELEKEARRQKVEFLEMDSSLTAEKFYSQNGYRVIEYAEHKLKSGKSMACVKMRKDFI